MAKSRAQDGQASVEFLGLLPLLAVLALVAWQGVVAGQAVWLTAGAAREAARARALGQDARSAALRQLPPRLRHGLRVQDDGADGVRVRVVVPVVGTGGARLGHVSARGRMEPQA